MKYKNAKPGQRVLFNIITPTYSRRFHAVDCYLGEIVEVGVEHKYRVTTGGWNGYSESRTTSKGIRVRVDGYQGEGRGNECGKELVVRPEMILDPTENPGGVDVWIEHWLIQNQEADRKQANKQQQEQADAARDARIEAVTGGMSLTQGRMVEIPSDVLDTLLALAENYSLGAKIGA